MTRYLLDVNLLLALTDPMHVHHEAAHRWFASDPDRSWATCPLTQNGFVRIASHPNYPNRPGDVPAVLAILRRFCEARGHEFWADDITILEVVEPDAIVTHAQITDVYLIGVAVKKVGMLATLDQHIPARVVHGGHRAVEIIDVKKKS